MTFEMTFEKLSAMMPNGAKARRLAVHWPHILDALAYAQIDNPARAAMFFAQVAVESGEYLFMEEIASGDVYEGRADLGNTQPGDGRRFKGHGPIQITGRRNHQLCGEALGIDLIAHPALITEPRYGTLSAAWFWKTNGLNSYADAHDIKGATRRINGGLNGLDQRMTYWDHNCKILGVVPGASPAAAPDVLEAGMTDALADGPVHALQRDLSALGYGLNIDGVYGPQTENAVRHFQRAVSLVVDGRAGPMTQKALKEALAA